MKLKLFVPYENSKEVDIALANQKKYHKSFEDVHDFGGTLFTPVLYGIGYIAAAFALPIWLLASAACALLVSLVAVGAAIAEDSYLEKECGKMLEEIIDIDYEFICFTGSLLLETLDSALVFLTRCAASVQEVLGMQPSVDSSKKYHEVTLDLQNLNVTYN